MSDADRLARDPAMRAVVDRSGLDRRAASTSQMGPFKTGWLTSEVNLAVLTDLSGARIDRVHARRPQSVIVLDMDSSVSETHGGQEGSAYNGRFGCTCYHPQFVFNQFGGLERCALRPGNVHSADGWRALLAPVIARYRGRVKRRYFRADAAFASPEIYELLGAEGYKYIIRLPANAVLQERIAWLLKRPLGGSPQEVRSHHASFSHRAGSWSKPRQVAAKVEWHPDELYPRFGLDPLCGSSVINMTRLAERVVAFSNQCGIAEQHIKEGKNAVTWTRLSRMRFAANAVRLQLHALAYNLAKLLRTLALPEDVKHWSLTTLQDRLGKIGARIVRRGRSIALQMAEVMVPRALALQSLAASTALRPLPPPA